MISEAIQKANDKAKQRVKEQQSFESAKEYSVKVKLNGLQCYVPLEDVQVQGVPLGDYLKKLNDTIAKQKTIEKVVYGLVQSSAEQSKLLEAIIQTLKGVKL